MSLSALYRRTLLQGGATLGCLGFAGLPMTPAGAAAEAGTAGVAAEPDAVALTGALAGWLVIAPDGSGQIRLVELDPDSNPVRQVAEETIAPATSLAGAARQANAAAVRAAARCWQVPAADCICAWGHIEYPRTGRTIPFTIWTDFV
jgi:hypothetical protein